MGEWEKGACNPQHLGYNYKIFLEEDKWRTQVFKKSELIGEIRTEVTQKPRCGMDVLDSSVIDEFISKTIENNVKEIGQDTDKED